MVLYVWVIELHNWMFFQSYKKYKNFLLEHFLKVTYCTKFSCLICAYLAFLKCYVFVR